MDSKEMRELRERCLTLAISVLPPAVSSEDVLQLAQKYYGFITK